MSLLLMFSICVSGFSQNWDVQLLRDINLHRNKDFDPLYRHISNSVLPLTLGLPLGVIVYEQSSGEGVGSKKRGLEMFAVTVGTVALSQGIKWTLNRERPYEKYPEIDPVYLAADPSFPSGHTASAFALATSATLIWPKWYVAVPAYTWAGSVAYSRMHLGLHYPTDVVAGAVLGGSTAYLCHYLNQKLFRKKKEKVLSVL
ncbi:MAG: phosphatase PAP2 family protein [Saprospiraceae bacterium]|nr:phosphatase PAP2 family protein [Saprospiraceae bacterium]MBP9193553.1 phosphatase PAP2 family protein [Saprospiraceae bacterium]